MRSKDYRKGTRRVIGGFARSNIFAGSTHPQQGFLIRLDGSGRLEGVEHLPAFLKRHRKIEGRLHNFTVCRDFIFSSKLNEESLEKRDAFDKSRSSTEVFGPGGVAPYGNARNNGNVIFFKVGLKRCNQIDFGYYHFVGLRIPHAYVPSAFVKILTFVSFVNYVVFPLDKNQ
jgi:hypothetical protein